VKRIQRRRSKGWRAPEGAIDVTRNGKPVPVGTPNRWGNPYDVKAYGREQSIALYRQDIELMLLSQRKAWLAPLHSASALMCWCPLDKPCHANVLIEYLDRE